MRAPTTHIAHDVDSWAIRGISAAPTGNAHLLGAPLANDTIVRAIEGHAHTHTLGEIDLAVPQIALA